jgi:hypothetical protein
MGKSTALSACGAEYGDNFFGLHIIYFLSEFNAKALMLKKYYMNGGLPQVFSFNPALPL